MSRKKKHLPEFDPLAGEGESSATIFADVHVPVAAEAEMRPEAIVVAEYRIDQIVPDFFQSRGGVLPREVAVALHKGDIYPAEALERWRELAAEDRALQERLGLLDQLAVSIRANGLINAIHIAEAEHLDGYVILAGERRYWAYWLLRDRYEEEGYDRIPAVLHPDTMRFLQIAENEDVEPLSTVSRARQVALAYLELLGIRPPAGFTESREDYWAFYRQAMDDPEELIGATYRPRGLWKELQDRLGMTRPSILRLLSILTLPDSALELADWWNLGQRQLLAVLKAPEDKREELVDLGISYNLAGNNLARLAKLAANQDGIAYNQAVSRLLGEDSAEAKSALRRPPIEKHTLRLLSGIRGIEKAAKGDYGQVARLIVGNHPDIALFFAENLERAATAIRDELGRE